jgi:hypothetical protein
VIDFPSPGTESTFHPCVVHTGLTFVSLHEVHCQSKIHVLCSMLGTGLDLTVPLALVLAAGLFFHRFLCSTANLVFFADFICRCHSPVLPPIKAVGKVLLPSIFRF